ncbi:hypothetical protein Tco_1024579 [Tanacetum coccineum]
MAVVPVGFDFEEFGALHDGIALQNLDQFCYVSFEQDDRRFISQAWNRLFRIKEQVVREYVMEFMSSFTFRDHIEKLDVADTIVFQLGRGKEEYDHEIVHSGSWSCRHSGKEKVTLDDLFLLHSMDGGVSVDVPWHVAKFLSDKAKGSKRKSPIVGAHLIGKIASYYALMTLRALMNVTLGLETSSMSVAKQYDQFYREFWTSGEMSSERLFIDLLQIIDSSSLHIVTPVLRILLFLCLTSSPDIGVQQRCELHVWLFLLIPMLFPFC